MNADHFYEIGSSHRNCQDYAISGTYEDLTYAILSDGCSSSKDTDLGARLICHVAKNTLVSMRTLPEYFSGGDYFNKIFPAAFKYNIVQKLKETREHLNLSYSIFDATLLVTFSVDQQRTQGGTFWGTLMFGDGAIVLRYKDKAKVTSVSYDSSAPYYLSYAMHEMRDTSYKESFGSYKCFVKTTDIDFESKVYNDVALESFDSNRSPTVFISSANTMETPLQIVLFSDGVGSFQKDMDIPELDVIQDCVTFISTAGEFVQRRMRNFLKKASSEGKSHYDDLSCAALNLV